MLKNLHVLKTCNPKNTPNCVPNYKNVYNPFDRNEDQTYHILSNGTIILNPYNMFPMYFAIDVNGASGPNKWGYDLFALMMISDGRRIQIVPYDSSPVEKGGKKADVFLYE